MFANSHLSISSADFKKLRFELSQKEGGLFKNKKIREKCAKILWANISNFPSSAVCLDVDSTVTKDEMIDQFAHFLGQNIRHITKQAMDGNLAFEEALAIRMALLNPSKGEYGQFVHNYKASFSPKVEELVLRLQGRGIPVFLVTGGFREIVEQKIAPKLAIPSERIFSNRLLFDENGNYSNFDKSQLTSKSGWKTVGKAGVCAFLKKRFGYEFVVMIGDGGTDLEASPTADLFIGFGGNQIREKVRRGSDWFVVDFGELLEKIEGNNFGNLLRKWKNDYSKKERNGGRRWNSSLF